MRVWSKIFLALSVLLWLLSYTRFGSDVLHGIPLPLAAVFFGLFLITWVLPRKDFDQFEQDQALRNKLLRASKKKPESQVERPSRAPADLSRLRPEPQSRR